MPDDGRTRDEAYIRKFLKWSETVERRLLQALAVFFLLIVIFQGLLLIGSVRERLTGTDRLEGDTSGFAPFDDRMVYYTSVKSGCA